MLSIINTPGISDQLSVNLKAHRLVDLPDYYCEVQRRALFLGAARDSRFCIWSGNSEITRGVEHHAEGGIHLAIFRIPSN